ncbi:MAG TPA: Sec-independent protein translocase protein TatB [Xanthobacteraceae bacterium]|jgi:sec-independent protein translocase protein TatB
MFDISWTEFLLIGVVALIVIGPKELPAVMRTLGQWTRKVRSMAADFQNQFQEALREAEMADLKKQVDDVAQDVRNYDPLKDVRDDFHAIGNEVERSLERAPGQGSADQPAAPQPPATPESADTAASLPAAAALSSGEVPAETASAPKPAPTAADATGRAQ